LHVGSLDILRTQDYKVTAYPEDLLLLENLRNRYARLGYGPYFALVHEYEKKNLKMIHGAGKIIALAAGRRFSLTALNGLTPIWNSNPQSS
jgi:hypothetical protein